MDVVGSGSTATTLRESDVRALLTAALRSEAYAGKRVLVIVPDGTRTAPIARMYRLMHEHLGDVVERLDYLIALGTHQPMSEAAIAQLVGLDARERQARTPKSRVFNHRWDLPETLVPVGVIPGSELSDLTGGLVCRETVVRINRMIFDYDALLILGPVFPHEVAGLSGGA